MTTASVAANFNLQQGNPVPPTSTSPTTADTTATAANASTVNSSPTAAAVSWVHSLTLTDSSSVTASDTDAVIAAVHAQVTAMFIQLNLSKTAIF
jgi:hypothetical protein